MPLEDDTVGPRPTADRPGGEPPPGSTCEDGAGTDRKEIVFINGVSRTYKMVQRAEEKKKLLSQQLPASVRAKYATTSYLFCTPTDCDKINMMISHMRHNVDDAAFDLDKIEKSVRSIKCRLKKKPVSSFSPLRTLRTFCTAFNRLTYLAKIRQYCDKNARSASYVRNQLNRRCNDGSKLSSSVYRFIRHADLVRYGDLCTVMAGMLCQTPHMWSRSIRMLGRLKVFLQNMFLKMFLDSGASTSSVFESCYQAYANRLAGRVKRLKEDAFALNRDVRVTVPRSDATGPSRRRKQPKSAVVHYDSGTMIIATPGDPSDPPPHAGDEESWTRDREIELFVPG